MPKYELPAPELVVVVKPEAGLRVGREELVAEEADAAPLAKAIDAAKADLQPLFGASEERLRAEAAGAAAIGLQQPDLSVYYRAEGAKDPAALAEEVGALDFVDSAYVKPPAEPPILPEEAAPLDEEPPLATPDFTPRQAYLDAAPGGVDARYAWTRQGGDGTGVNVIDVEGAWRFTHEDLLGNQGGVIGGTMSTEQGWRDHGTAVIGEFGGDPNTIGVTGISPAANTRAISIFGSGMGSAQAIRQAANSLGAGDIILIELHRPGPRHAFESREDQLGYIAVEFWPDDFDAILYATSRGVIVVEAAGNGAENLDDALYDTRPSGFPSTWTNPFNRANRDSGAIVVGAGAPPPGTHGHDHGPDRSRLGFSNYGALIDAQGWGREVTTCGYGDLQGGVNEDVWYTDRFSGTSSASPIVVGVLAALQGFARANGQQLTPSECRGHLRASGSPQQASSSAPVSQRIGNRPDLRALIARISPVKKEKLEKFEGKEKLEKFEGKEKAEIKEKREKIELKEKREIKEKIEKVEFERQEVKLEIEVDVKKGFQIDPLRERLRAPGFSARLTDKKFWSKEKLEKGEKEAKGEFKDKDEKREKSEREEKDPKPEKDVTDKGDKNEKNEKDKDEKGEQAEAGKQDKDGKDFKDSKDEKGDKDKENKDEKGEQENKEATDAKTAKDNKNEKFENKEKEKEDFEDIPEPIFRRQGKFMAESGFDRRLERLEQLVSHFIDPKLRPDLSEGALTHEPDTPRLGEEAAAAKRSKEAADTKLSEA